MKIISSIVAIVLGSMLLVGLGSSGVAAQQPPWTACELNSSSSLCSDENATPEGRGGAENTIKRVIELLLYAVGALSVIMIIISAIRLVVSAGNTTIVTEARKGITYAVVGLLVAMFGYAIVNGVFWLLTR